MGVRSERPLDRAGVRDVVMQAFADEPVVADLVDALREHPAGRDDLEDAAPLARACRRQQGLVFRADLAAREVEAPKPRGPRGSIRR